MDAHRGRVDGYGRAGGGRHYAVALAAVTAAGVSTNYALTLYYGL